MNGADQFSLGKQVEKLLPHRTDGHRPLVEARLLDREVSTWVAVASRLSCYRDRFILRPVFGAPFKHGLHHTGACISKVAPRRVPGAKGKDHSKVDRLEHSSVNDQRVQRYEAGPDRYCSLD
jgi:hypothetical protein